jgi:cytidylate kinase
MENTLQHLGTTLEHLSEYWAARHRAAAAQGQASQPIAPPFTIALCRQAGTPGSSVAQEVGKRLGWQVYDHELLDQIAQDTGLRTSLLESVDERGVSLLREAFEAVMSVPSVSEGAYIHHLVKTVLALGAHGQCVIVGRGAAFILPVDTTLRVRLGAPVHDRIAALSRKLGLSEKEAARQLRTIDRERIDFVQDHFHKDPTDLQYYDLVLNVGRLPVPAGAAIITEALHHLQACAIEKGAG